MMMSFRHRYGTNPGYTHDIRIETHTNINSNRYVVMLKLYDMRRGEIFNLTAK